MMVKDIIMKHKWEEVQPLCLKHYPSDYAKSISGFENVFYDLQKKEATFSREKRILKIDFVDDGKDSYHHTDFRKDDIEYGLDFLPWDEVLGMTIHKETLEKYTEAEIICHVIWEITFYGFSEEAIKAEGETILQDDY